MVPNDEDQCPTTGKTPHITRSSAVPVGGLGRVDTGCTLSASRFSRCQRLENMRSRTGCRTTGYGNVRAGWTAPLLRVFVSTKRRTRSSCRFDQTRRQGVGVDDAAGGRLAMTAGLVGDGGGLSTRAQPEYLLRLMPSGSNAQPMGRQSLRFRGRDTTSATLSTSTRWRRGLRCEPRKVRPVNCYGWRGGPSGRSSPESTTTSRPGLIVFPVCGGSGLLLTLQLVVGRSAI